jgi:DNA polymerase-3 subunit epsilon
MTFIKSIQTSENKIILKNLGAPSPGLLITDQECISIVFLDTETTGVNRANDKIIELALKMATFEKSSGIIVSIDQVYESFNDPGEEISQEITMLTGISNDMVQEQSIDWGMVDTIIKDADIVVAHNASFDRAFVEKHSSVSPNKIWACSINDIDWLGRGFSSAKQELLCYWHGFYFEAHRAMNDVDALMHLLTHPSYDIDRPVLELIENSQKPTYVIFATNFNYDPVKKDIVKANKYKWNTNNKVWYKNVKFDNLESEKDWLTSVIYDFNFEGRVDEINPVDKYKL